MKITLALLTYNREAVTERIVREISVESAKAFPCGDWKLFVINDGSRDGVSATLPG